MQHDAQSPSSAALSDLLRRVREVIVRYSRRQLQSRPDADDLAEDISQQASIRVARSIMACRATTDEQFVSWVLTVAKHVIVDEVRSPSRQVVVGRADDDMKGIAAIYSHDAWVHEWDDLPQGAELTLARLICAAYERLPSRTANLVWSHIIHHATWAEVAVASGTTPAGVKRRYQRAECTLRRLILQEIETLPTEERRSVLDALATRRKSLEKAPHKKEGCSMSSTSIGRRRTRRQAANE